MQDKTLKKVEDFFSQFKSQKYKKGAILIHVNEDPSGIFYLKQGMVKEYAISKKGDELIINIFRPSSFFPMPWAVSDIHNSYYFEAITDVEVLKAPKEEVVVFVKRESDVLYDLLSRVFKGMDGVLTKMTYLMSGNAYARLMIEIIILAERFGVKNNVSLDDVVLKTSDIDLAAQTGMTRETVSREMKKLKDKGLIILNKDVLQIISLRKLKEELEALE